MDRSRLAVQSRYGGSARVTKSNSLMMLRQTVPSSAPFGPGILAGMDATDGGAPNVMHEKRILFECSPLEEHK